MPINVIRGGRDPIVDEIVEAMGAFLTDHPSARIDLYRQDPVSVRVRVIDAAFSGLGKAERSRLIWRRYLGGLSDDAQSDISTMTLLAPEEISRSVANLDFEDALPLER